MNRFKIKKGLTADDCGASSLRREHNCKSDNYSLTIRGPHEHLLPRHSIQSVYGILLLDVLKFPVGKGIGGIRGIPMEFLHDFKAIGNSIL